MRTRRKPADAGSRSSSRARAALRTCLGMTASMTPLPVIGVPVESKSLKGMDSLLSIVQMPAGVPVGTVAIGRAGAVNAALLAAAIVALGDERVAAALDEWRANQTAAVAETPQS